MEQPIDRNWRVLAALSVLIVVSMALPIYGGSVVNTYMVVDSGWDRRTLGLLLAGNMFAYAASAPAAAYSVNRLGVGRTQAIGCMALIVSGAFLATVVSRPWQALLGYGLMTGFASAFSGVIACQAVIAAWFRRRRTMALSILYAAQGVGGFAVVAFINRLIESSGRWSLGWWVFTAAGALGIAVIASLVRMPSAGKSAAAAESAAGPAAGPTLGQAIRSPLLWIICLTMFTLVSGSGVIIAHSQVLLRGAGLSPSSAAFAMSLYLGATVFGNLGFGALVAWTGVVMTYLASLLIFSGGLLLLTGVDDNPKLAAYALAAGIGFGASQVGSMAMLGDHWGARLFPALTAIGLVVQTCGGALAPVLAGAWFDAHHSYTLIIYAIAAANAAAALMLVLAKRPDPSHVLADALANPGDTR